MAILRSIDNLLGRQWTVKVCYVYREANNIANRMATIAYDMDVEFYHFDSPLTTILDWLRHDIISVGHYRLVL